MRAKRLLAYTLSALCLAGAAFHDFGRPALAETTIEFWSFLDPSNAKDVRSRTLQDILSGFERANPEIKVRTTVMEWSEIGPALLRAQAARKVPDLAMMFSSVIGVHVAAKTLHPLDSYLSKWPTDHVKDLIILPSARDREGHVYGLPWELRVTGILYRKDILEKSGSKIPGTLPELADAAKSLASEGSVGIGLGFSPAKPDAGMDWFIPTLIGMGSKPLNPDGTANFRTPEMKQLVGFVHDLVHKYKVLPQDVALLGDDQVQTFAEAGRTVFLPKMTHRVTFIRDKSGLGQAYQMMDAPTFDKNKLAPAYVQGWNLSIPKGAANPDAAWKLIEYWTSKEVQVAQSNAAGYLPVRASAAADPSFAAPEAAHIRWALDYSSRTQLEFEWPANISLLYTTLAKAVSSVISNRAAVDDALATAEREYNAAKK